MEHGDNPYQSSEIGDPAIIRASVKGDFDIIKLLLEHDAFPNARDKRHLIALHWAARKRFEKVAEGLVYFGADVNSRDIDHWTALYYPIYLKSPSTFLQDLLINVGVDVLEPDRFGDTMLHHVTQNAYIEGMERLLTAGSLVNQLDSNEKTALHVAAARCFVKGVVCLVEAFVCRS